MGTSLSRKAAGVVSAAAAAAAPVAAVVATAEPAAAESHPQCLGDYDGFRPVRTDALNTAGSSFSPGTAVLYYNPGNRCVFGKVSIGVTGRWFGQAWLEKNTGIDPAGCILWNSAESNYCITDKYYDGGTLARTRATASRLPLGDGGPIYDGLTGWY